MTTRNTVTTAEIRRRTGSGISTITRKCRELGYEKIGRDYHLTPEQAERVISGMRSGPGRPKKGKK